MRSSFRYIFTFLLLAPYILQAQTDYTAKWKFIDSLIEKKGLSRSAMAAVDRLYKLSKKEHNESQMTKALIYRLRLNETIQDNYLSQNVRDIQNEIKQVSQPSKSILQSILAGILWNYYQINQGILYNRTRTMQTNKNEVDTWGISDFKKSITNLFLESISDEKILKQTPLASVEPILIKGNSRNLRPTLYDLLAHRALDFFKNDQFYLPKPANAFEILAPSLLGAKAQFVNFNFTSHDTSSLHFRALLIFQHLLRFHENDQKPDASIDVDIERIRFVYQYGVMKSKDSLYMRALFDITNRYPVNPMAASSWLLQAQHYADLASRYNYLGDTSNRYDYLKAKLICENVINEPDSSEGKSGCQQLLRNILSREIRLETENVNIPGNPFRVLVTYKNLNRIYFRLVGLDDRTKKLLPRREQNNDIIWKSLVSLGGMKTFVQSIPDPADLQVHRAEIKIEALGPGEYVLIASQDSLFRLQSNPLSAQFFNISRISFINNGENYFVLDRETGQPLSGTDVQAWYTYYDSKLSKWLERKGENFNTNKNGYFQLKESKIKTNDRLRLEFRTKNDRLNSDIEYSPYRYWRNSEENEDWDDEEEEDDKEDFENDHLKTFFFTDRAIYRPGQLVYFKGIVTSKEFETRLPRVMVNFSSRVYLRDANNQPIDSIQVVTNEFGSYHGQFRLPRGKLPGQFSIDDQKTQGNQSFSVEEYKRPKFYVEYNKMKGTYRLGEKIQMKGWAKGYSGNTIDGANVKFRITRKANFPYPWLLYSRPFPTRGGQEIEYGELKTASDGSFIIEFQALPDPSINKEFNPIFEFEVSAEITDRNGETRTGQTSLMVGYQSIIIHLNLEEESFIATEQPKSLPIRTTNLAGEFEPARLHLTIYSLSPPDRLIRPRYWQEPDQFVMSKDEYLKYFPHDEYQNERKKENWTKGERIFEEHDSSNEDGKLRLPELFTKPGWYLIEIETNDAYGNIIKTKCYVELTEPGSSSLAYPQYILTETKDVEVEPGNPFVFKVGSGADSVFLIHQTFRKKTSFDFVRLNNSKKDIKIPIEESDRGGVIESICFVKDNRMFTNTVFVNVPWSNKTLNIRYSSYRDKTLPGSNEKWKAKISGNKKEIVAAEVLSAMYDASLDQFEMHNWKKPGLYPINSKYSMWGGVENFRADRSQDFYEPSEMLKPYVVNYDDIIPAWVEIKRYYSVLSGAVKGLDVVARGYATRKSLADTTISNSSQDKAEPGDMGSAIQIRKNFNETAFFFPDLRTDDSGNVEFSFVMPEALTQWKWMSFAHTRNLAFGYKEATIITQKQLMVQPNPPRFLRSGDHIEFPVKIANMTDSEMTGQAQLQLIDPSTNQPVDGWFSNRQANQYFTTAARQSSTIYFPIDVPFEYNKPLEYRVEARAGSSSGNLSSGQISDGEQAMLPVLSNRILVTESLPLNMIQGGTKEFRFEELLKSAGSESLSQYALSVEFTSNPAWYAVQSLPYLMQFPYECAEQVFNRFYANALGSYIVKSSLRIRELFEKWKKDSIGMMSRLQENQELKSVLLQETPWVLESKSEAQQQKNLALLMDGVRMHNELETAFNQLISLRNEGGGFPWFKGGPDDRYISQYILTGFGHLRKLGAIPSDLSARTNLLLKETMAWTDKKIQQDYERQIKNTTKDKSPVPIGPIDIQWLFMHSFFPEIPILPTAKNAYDYNARLANEHWQEQNKFMQGMIALWLHRKGDDQLTKQVLASIKENAIHSEELGMYWKGLSNSYYWYQSPLETVSLLIEAFAEINNDKQSVLELKTWLLKQKQTQNWATTRATADACYALLLQGSDWLVNNPSIRIALGKTEISNQTFKTIPGTGYIKESIFPPAIKPEMGNIKVTLSPSPGEKKLSPAWGAVYWQYFEDMDMIRSANQKSNPLKLTKKIFIKKNTDSGPILQPISENGILSVGDRITVRLELRSDREMEYVHLKDMRGSCMEPLYVLSAYKWQGGMGYYEATQDASTNFFFDRLPKGVHVFEYELFVSASGSFTNGIATIQCMYAPEFGTHSESIKLNVQQAD